MVWFIVAVMALLAGILQTVTGFGAVVLMMMVFPFFFTIIDSATMALFISVIQSFVVFWTYRKHIIWKLALPPTVLYALASLVVIHYLGEINARMLVLALGVFLIILSVYFLVFARKAKLEPKPAVGIACGTVSGITGGLFGIGGPPMALYFVSATENHEAYLACLQFLFSVTSTVNIVGKVCNGLFSLSILPYCGVGVVCVLLGKVIGEKITGKLNADTMRTIIYVFVGISGLILLLQQL